MNDVSSDRLKMILELANADERPAGVGEGTLDDADGASVAAGRWLSGTVGVATMPAWHAVRSSAVAATNTVAPRIGAGLMTTLRFCAECLVRAEDPSGAVGHHRRSVAHRSDTPGSGLGYVLVVRAWANHSERGFIAEGRIRDADQLVNWIQVCPGPPQPEHLCPRRGLLRQLPGDIYGRSSQDDLRLDVTFWAGMVPCELMDTAVAVVGSHDDVEAVYRADGERLWRAIDAFAGMPRSPATQWPRRSPRS